MSRSPAADSASPPGNPPCTLAARRWGSISVMRPRAPAPPSAKAPPLPSRHSGNPRGTRARSRRPGAAPLAPRPASQRARHRPQPSPSRVQRAHLPDTQHNVLDGSFDLPALRRQHQRDLSRQTSFPPVANAADSPCASLHLLAPTVLRAHLGCADQRYTPFLRSNSSVIAGRMRATPLRL